MIPYPQRKIHPPVMGHLNNLFKCLNIFLLSLPGNTYHLNIAEFIHIEKLWIRRSKIPVIFITKQQSERIKSIRRHHIKVFCPIRLVIEKTLKDRFVHRINWKCSFYNFRLFGYGFNLIERIVWILHPPDTVGNIQKSIHQSSFVSPGYKYQPLTSVTSLVNR